jgi:hypothetical protein
MDGLKDYILQNLRDLRELFIFRRSRRKMLILTIWGDFDRFSFHCQAINIQIKNELAIFVAKF